MKLPLNLANVVDRLHALLGPEVRRDESRKIVEIREGIFGNKLLEAYYTLKGYRVLRVSSFSLPESPNSSVYQQS